MPKGGKGRKKQPGDVKYDASSELQCPDCSQMVHVGTGGPGNLANHKACAPLVSSTSNHSENENEASLPSSPLRDTSSNIDNSTLEALDTLDAEISIQDYMVDDSASAIPPEQTCKAIRYLRIKLKQIPPHITGTSLAIFAGNPADFFGPSEPEERDMILHHQLEHIFAPNSSGYDLDSVRQHLYRGSHGLDAFCDFFEYFVCKREYSIKNILDIILFLEEAIDHEYPDLFSVFNAAVEFNFPTLSRQQFTSGTLERIARLQPLPPPLFCPEWRLIFPEGKNAHTSYPFGMHAEFSLPWGYEFAQGSRQWKLRLASS
ncbi:hypothetical protein C8R45DRAFT_945151 [Mycena sanguinolenta]|nr:hypothetical protein C8R45DRAFT_945151 [Mycena sanguinolenta]